MTAVRVFVGSALTISFGLACRDYAFDRNAFHVWLLFQKVYDFKVVVFNLGIVCLFSQGRESF